MAVFVQKQEEKNGEVCCAEGLLRVIFVYRRAERDYIAVSTKNDGPS